ncbi:Hypothetical predicted protein [Paramuricea clavata]|uniref:Uncharacterized protein n=1 Tax=Paramuricea clavata TaxID=317549 RepID=A0A6S7LU14_PARCT|nr:Hypothetical predicted protein [Paramuricea clavata]
MVAAKRTVRASTINRRVDVKLSESLLFLHAVSGCDTTSRPHGIGKVGVLKKYAALAESAAMFMASESSKVALETAGERAVLIMYGSQVQLWKGNDLPPEEWGWARSSTGLVPVQMSEPLSQQPQRSSCETSDVIVVADVIHDLAPASRTVFSALQRAANLKALYA